jgi:hypothetical protein
MIQRLAPTHRPRRLRAAFALLLLAGLAGSGRSAVAQDFTVEDVPSATGLPLAQMKPHTIVFSDHRNEELAQHDTGLIKFDDWERARPLQKQFLNLFPGYVEPMVTVTRSGITKRYREKLHVYVAEARFVLDKPPAAVDLARYASLPFLQRIDPAIKHKIVQLADTMAASQGDQFPNRRPARQWCDPQAVAVCLDSYYKFEGKLPLGIALANKLRESEKKIADFLDFQSEVRILAPENVDVAGLAQLTGIDSPITGVLEQNIFYVNQVMQFGRFIAVRQAHPTDPDKTVATVFMALAVKSDIFEKKKEFEKVPVLRNLVPALVLMGSSTFNSGNSISAGLPAYARNRIKAIADILERE